MKHRELELIALSEALVYINDVIKKHEEAILKYKKAICQHYWFVNKHETDLPLVSERESELGEEMNRKHKDKAESHRLQMDAHERFKRYHHSVLVLTKT
ncbi:MAG: hypothetical protein AAF731_15380 [Bacteroidota bacterium]